MKCWLGDPVDLLCAECGHPGRAVMTDVGAAEKASCAPCWTAYVDRHHCNRAEFDALIAGGVNRRMANRIMCVRLGLSTDGI